MNASFLKQIAGVATAVLTLAAGAAETNPPVVAVYTVPGLKVVAPGERADFGPKIVVAAWGDGKIVWSESAIEGGRPYRQGRFPREKLDALLASLDRQGAFTNAALTRGWVGPDAGFSTIVIADGSRRLKLQSWHELFETNSNLVATVHGITPLDGKKREDVLRDQPEGYRQFRETWSAIRRGLTELVPATSEPYEGKIPLPPQSH
jgi:hypothetical protein